MRYEQQGLNKDWGITVAIGILSIFSVAILRSIAPFVFPLHLFYLIVGLIIFLVFSQIDFDILALFSKHFYIGSVILLIVTLIIGQFSRGAVRWIPIGPVTIQPAELVRPFLLIFFAKYLNQNRLTFQKTLTGCILFAVPFLLILIQPSLGVSLLLLAGFGGVVLTSKIDKRLLLIGFILLIIASPLSWFALAPYQKERILTAGSGYNSVQAMISVGSGQIAGRGLGKGVQTQLYFLPEKHTDFIFASISEELGFFVALAVVLILGFILFRIIQIAELTKNPIAKSFVTGIFFSMFAEIFIHIAMNMGMLPITGLTLPFVSSGGSSLLTSFIAMGMVVGSKK